MIYSVLPPEAPLEQGEILDSCPIVAMVPSEDGTFEPAQRIERVMIVTQACDLANPNKQRVTVAVVYAAAELVKEGILTAGTIRDHARRHRTYGWYFLPAGDDLPESLVDLHDLHSASRLLLEQLARDGHRVCRFVTPYREHLAQHFAVTYSRIGLPEPYRTE